jgi:hypothetical protein
MLAISSLTVGTQYYRADDLPFYNKDLRTQVVVVAVGIVLPLCRKVFTCFTTGGP